MRSAGEERDDAARSNADCLDDLAARSDMELAAARGKIAELEETLGGYKIIHLDQAGQIDRLIHEREDEKGRAEKAEAQRDAWKAAFVHASENAIRLNEVMMAAMKELQADKEKLVTKPPE